MPEITVHLPEILNQYVESEMEEGRYNSKEDAIQKMIQRDIKERYSVDEQLSRETLQKIEKARHQEDEGDVEALIEDHVRGEIKWPIIVNRR